MVQENRRVIVTFEDGGWVDREPSLWYNRILVNTYANSDNIDRVVQYNNEQVDWFTNNPPHEQIYKLSWTATPQTDTITKSLMPWKKPKNMVELAGSLNPKLRGWAEEKLRANKRLGGVIKVDYYTQGEVVEVAILANQK